MKNLYLTTSPAAKITIGNQGSITFDTISNGKKKTFQIKIETDKDTIIKEVDDIVEEIKTGINNHMEETSNERMEEIHNERLENETLRQNSREFFSVMGVGMLLIFIYAMFRSYQNRKWKEALLNKGVSTEEINILSDSKPLVTDIEGNDLQSFEKKKQLKYAIFGISFGLAMIIGGYTGEFAYFIGFLALFLGSGYWYFYSKTN